MQITSAKYTDGGVIVATINGSEMSVPDDAGNRHRKALAAWEAAGNTITPFDAPDPREAFRETASLPRYAFLSACVSAGVITQDTAEEAADGSWPAAFNTFLAGLDGAQRIAAKAVWADGKEVRRDSTILAQIAASDGVNVTDDQLDAMFGWEA